jgi:hypothetical protein
MAGGFEAAWKELTRVAPVTVSIARGEQLSASDIQQKIRKEKPDEFHQSAE